MARSQPNQLNLRIKAPQYHLQLNYKIISLTKKEILKSGYTNSLIKKFITSEKTSNDFLLNIQRSRYLNKLIYNSSRDNGKKNIGKEFY